MDDDQKELLNVGAETAMKPFSDLIDAIRRCCRGNRWGWKDRLAFCRQIRQIKLLQKLRAAIDEAGFEPRAIPDNIWVPAIQSASIQDDETIQDMRARLLADAANVGEDVFHSTFVGLLNQLTPTETRFLNLFYSHVNTKLLEWDQLPLPSPNRVRIYRPVSWPENLARSGPENVAWPECVTIESSTYGGKRSNKRALAKLTRKRSEVRVFSSPPYFSTTRYEKIDLPPGLRRFAPFDRQSVPCAGPRPSSLCR